ncbi:unnamed protein product [Vitrella brassicaformis CCMP3155]|uniref:J domain-containing protein n=2 Tax=Vitrella brassicaformis TaxID=1169539 RepID=A0A0G4E9G9_VITBC|nr:unnamed protein product [Vitrella brassicaformis CCMP3155]|mmetsp:Transcript_28985/g.72250  ORF Transcript_28985/g.72250 Transcript_28985/m.72250 type:complete len:435 (+) Transcript_28985:64-1368(+)|eukprot:CEL92522.1 unnamed protein product [Vitrella brassicaformis CCMP3155]
MRRSFVDFYKVLGVSPQASSALIKTAFYDLAKRFHPDAGGRESSAAKTAATGAKSPQEHFKLVNEAYQTLSKNRAAYDDEYRQNLPSFAAQQARYRAQYPQSSRPSESARPSAAHGGEQRRGGQQGRRQEATRPSYAPPEADYFHEYYGGGVVDSDEEERHWFASAKPRRSGRGRAQPHSFAYWEDDVSDGENDWTDEREYQEFCRRLWQQESRRKKTKRKPQRPDWTHGDFEESWKSFVNNSGEANSSTTGSQQPPPHERHKTRKDKERGEKAASSDSKASPEENQTGSPDTDDDRWGHGYDSDSDDSSDDDEWVGRTHHRSRSRPRYKSWSPPSKRQGARIFTVASRMKTDGSCTSPPRLDPQYQKWGNRVEPVLFFREKHIMGWLSMHGEHDRLYGVFRDGRFSYSLVWKKDNRSWDQPMYEIRRQKKGGR